MTSNGIDEWPSNRYYPARTILGLPRDMRFDDVTLTIDYARQSEVTSVLPTVMTSAIDRADNVGVDEFDGPYREYLTQYSFIFTARWKQSGMIAAFIVIGPSVFSRTIDASLADIHVFRTGDVTDTVYIGLVGLSVALTTELDVGYMDCLVSMAVTCSNLIDLLINQLQFRIILTIPQSVKIAGVEDQLVDNQVLIRSILPPDNVRESRSIEQVLSMLSQHGIADGPDDDAKYEKAMLTLIPFLPEKYSLPNDSLVITFRNMYKHEDRLLFEMLNRSIDKGEGIALYDLPNLALFRRFILEGSCVVFEDSSNGCVIGYIHITPSWLIRTSEAECAETTLIIDKPYQSRGIGRVLVKLIKALVKQHGSKALVNDYFSNNVRSQRLSSRFATVLGVIPRAAYLVGKGWQEQVIARLDVSREPSFTQLIEENRVCSSTVTKELSKL